MRAFSPMVGTLIELFQGDAREVLAKLPTESVQCVVTSPPYWGLRKYAGGQDLLWGGKADCEHQWMDSSWKNPNASGGPTKMQANNKGSFLADYHQRTIQGATCSLCGCWRGAFGLEPTIEMYVEHTVEFLRAIKRVLREDGVMFWNIGDSYAGGKGQSGQPMSAEVQEKRAQKGESLNRAQHQMEMSTRPSDSLIGLRQSGLKPKDLCLIPFRVALAAQADGWWVRSIIIWAKSNPMPESVQDRPTDAFDYILMLTKSANYYWDQEAVREQLSPLTLADSRNATGRHTYQESKWDEQDKPSWYRAKTFVNPSTGRNLRNVWTFPTEPFGLEMCQTCGRVYEPKQFQELAERIKQADITRDRPLESPIHAFRGEGWETQEIEGRGQETKEKICRCGASQWLSHFAVFPKELPARCILAATSEKGNCPKCGKSWVRISQKELIPQAKRSPTRKENWHSWEIMGSNKIETLGWQPQCSCGEEPIPATVLDPFCGSGTTLVAAKELGRSAIGIDLSPEYISLARYRLDRTQPGMRLE